MAKAFIIGSDIKVIVIQTRNESQAEGSITYLDRIITPGFVEIISQEENLFLFNSTLYQLHPEETWERCFN